MVDVLSEAFAGYPVMRYVLDGPAPADDPRLRTLMHFFVMARLWRRHPVLGARDGGDGSVVAVATITPPDPGPTPEDLHRLRDQVWRELGPDARSRYETFGAAAESFVVDGPHHHLNMVGVRPSHEGEGLAGGLLDAVHRLAADHPVSTGVTLTTEEPENVTLYERFGYRRTGHARVADGLETWGFFRPVG